MGHQEGDVGEELHHVIAVGDRVQAVLRDTVETECRRLVRAVGIIGRARERRRPDGGLIQALFRVREPVRVAQEHEGIRHQVLPEGDGLCALQVGVAAHHGLLVGLRLVRQGSHKGQELPFELIGDLAREELHIQCDLVVSTARGMQFLPHGADARDERLLDEGMDILRRKVDLERAALDIREDAAERGDEDLRLFRRDDPLLPEHRRVCDGAGDVLRVQALIEGDGRVESLRRLVDGAVRTPCPQFAHYFFTLLFTSACTLVGNP